MRYTFATVLLLCASCALGAIHVSVQGGPQGDGSAQRPAALLAAGVSLARQDPEHRVIVHAGEYFDTGVQLTPADSGLTIEAAGNSRPALYGGIPLTGWTANADGTWSAPLPAGHTWDVRLLCVDGELAQRARFPEQGKLTHKSVFDVPWMSTTGGGWKRKPTDEELTTMKFDPADLPRDIEWRNAEVTVYHVWDESVSGVARCDYDKATLTFTNKLGHPAGGFGVKTYVIWNIRQGLTASGEWMFDRVNARVVYRPKPGQDMAKARILVPTRTSIIELLKKGEEPVRNITLRGLELGITTVPGITGGFGAGNFPGAIQFDAVDTLTIEDLRIRNVAGQGIGSAWSKASKNVKVRRSEIAWCGAGGISIAGENLLYEDNRIHHIGRIFPSGIGISRGGINVVVRHNVLHDCSYSAIGLDGANTLVENNEFYRCMTELHDGAAVYFGNGKQHTIRGNFVHDLTDPNEGRPWGSPSRSAYYLDEQCENCTVENNLAVNVEMPSQNHMARKNTIRGNIFVTGGNLVMSFARCSDYTVEGNAIQAGGDVKINGANLITTWRNNIVHSGSGKVVSVSLEDYAQKQSDNTAPLGTTISNPQITVSDNGVCTLAHDSSARALNLPKLDFSDTGPRPPIAK